MMGTSHTHLLAPTDQLVGRGGDTLGIVNEQRDALAHADQFAGR